MFISQEEKVSLTREARVEAMRLRQLHGDAAESICREEYRRTRLFSRRRLFWRNVEQALARTMTAKR